MRQLPLPLVLYVGAQVVGGDWVGRGAPAPSECSRLSPASLGGCFFPMIFGCRVFADLSYGSWHVAVVRRRRVVSVSGARCGYVLGEPFGEAVRFCYEVEIYVHS